MHMDSEARRRLQEMRNTWLIDKIVELAIDGSEAEDITISAMGDDHCTILDSRTGEDYTGRWKIEPKGTAA